MYAIPRSSHLASHPFELRQEKEGAEGDSRNQNNTVNGT
jgi:hypothetical protein